MALVACRGCGDQVSVDALKCPKCGQPYPNAARYYLALVGVGALVLMGAGYLWSGHRRDVELREQRAREAVISAPLQ